MYSVLAIDLDDTLVRSDGTVSPYTLTMLDAWCDRGGRVVVATGRSPRSTRLIPPALHRFPWICYNGAAIYEDSRFIFEDNIQPDDLRTILSVLLEVKPDCRLSVEASDRLYANWQHQRSDAELLDDLLSIADQPAAKVLLSLDQYEALAECHHRLPLSTRALISPRYRFVQILSKSVSKAAGLQHVVAKRWGLSLSEVVAFGDDTNDIEMIRESGLGVAMGNAVPEVKAVADRETVSNDEDGVAIIIAELLGYSAQRQV